jgi:transposase
MYIDIVPNRKSPPAILLRESVREGKKIVKKTIANLSSLTLEQAQAIRMVLKGESLVRPEDHFDIVGSQAHGHISACLIAIKKLKVEQLLGSRRSRERDLVVAMLVSRIVDPESKLAFSRNIDNTTLGVLLEAGDTNEDELYKAMDWLFERQKRIEKKLAARHLHNGGRVLYDLSSSYFEGSCCALAAHGYNRDGKKGKLQVNYGLLTDDRGCPISISVFPGNTSDTETLIPQVDQLREDFNLDTVVLVGDRGMISQKQVDKLREYPGVDWITALKSGAIRKLMSVGAIQLGLFDERNLFELSHPDYPGERLVACRNPELAFRRTNKRQALLEATSRELDKVQGMIDRGFLKQKDKIGLRVGRIINKYKMAKHFILDIGERHLSYHIDEKKVAEEASLDGIYIIRTSLSQGLLSPDDAVRHYKDLSHVEQAFRSIKTMDLLVRPIHHRLEGRVRAHLFICMLAYYVKWHMLEAWRPLLFADEDLMAKKERDPVEASQRSKAAHKKVHSKRLPDDSPVQSFQSLLKNLGKIVRNTCRRKDVPDEGSTFTIDTKPSEQQTKALQLVKTIKM